MIKIARTKCEGLGRMNVSVSDTIYLDGELSAVVKVEAAQKILVGFAFAGMLVDDQAGHDPKRVAGPQEGHGIHLRAAYAHGAGGGRLQRG